MFELVYFNGDLIPRSEAKISVMDYGFLYGYGLFETMRAYNGQVFRLDTHISRLMSSASLLGLKLNPDTLKQAVKDTIAFNDLSSARVRITVSGGEGSMVPNPDSCETPTVLVAATEYHPLDDEAYEKGFKLATSGILRSNCSPVSSMKTLNYMECLLARREAKAAGYDEALLLNVEGRLAEAATSNIFLIHHGTLVTPGLDSGILPGITRYVIAELADKLDINLIFADLPVDEACDASEVFISNSIMEIMAVTSIDDKMIADGKPGQVTRQLQQAYQGLVKEETAFDK